MTDRLPIADFIEGRMRSLDLSRGQLALCCGCKNASKTLRRIYLIVDGATR
jgi:hypothetical protein